MQNIFKLNRKLSPLPIAILETVSSTISRYRLLTPGQSTAVAFSGGKDSIFTMLVLRELGYFVMPVIVDMGYEKDWDKKIVTLANNIGFKNAEVLHSKKAQDNITKHARQKLNFNVKILNNSELFLNKNITPCTYCYNAKSILLENVAIQKNISSIAFGHHSIDAIASMLKSAFMYIDRWDARNEIFSHSRFSDLVDLLSLQLVQKYEYAIQSPVFIRIANLCYEYLAATDEPPFQFFNISSRNIKLIRPLFNVRESLISKYIEENCIKTEGSGCGHGATKNSQTPREMIHFRILKLIDESVDDPKLIHHLMELVLFGLDENGGLISNLRNLRAEIFGSQYKNSKVCQGIKV